MTINDFLKWKLKKKNYRETHRQVGREISEFERGTEKESKCIDRYEKVKKMSHLYWTEGQKKWNTYRQTDRNGKVR